MPRPVALLDELAQRLDGVKRRVCLNITVRVPSVVVIVKLVDERQVIARHKLSGQDIAGAVILGTPRILHGGLCGSKADADCVFAHLPRCNLGDNLASAVGCYLVKECKGRVKSLCLFCPCLRDDADF